MQNKLTLCIIIFVLIVRCTAQDIEHESNKPNKKVFLFDTFMEISFHTTSKQVKIEKMLVHYKFSGNENFIPLSSRTSEFIDKLSRLENIDSLIKHDDFGKLLILMCYAHEHSSASMEFTIPLHSAVSLGENGLSGSTFKVYDSKSWKVYAKNGQDDIYFELNLEKIPYHFKIFDREKELEIEIDRILEE